MEHNNNLQTREGRRETLRRLFPRLDETKFPFRYSVFIAHRGEAKSIAVNIYHRIAAIGFKSFIDSFSFHPGAVSDRTLFDMILPRVHYGAIILLSQHFFESKWCWNEFLLLIARRIRFPNLKLWIFWVPSVTPVYRDNNVQEYTREELLNMTMEELRPDRTQNGNDTENVNFHDLRSLLNRTLRDIIDSHANFKENYMPDEVPNPAFEIGGEIFNRIRDDLNHCVRQIKKLTCEHCHRVVHPLTELLVYARHENENNSMITLVCSCGDTNQSHWVRSIDDAQRVLQPLAIFDDHLQPPIIDISQAPGTQQPVKIKLQTMTGCIKTIGTELLQNRYDGIIDMTEPIIHAYKTDTKEIKTFIDWILGLGQWVFKLPAPLLGNSKLAKEMRVVSRYAGREWLEEYLGMHPAQYLSIVFIERLAIPMIHHKCPYDYSIFVRDKSRPSDLATRTRNFLRQQDYDVEIFSYEDGTSVTQQTTEPGSERECNPNWASCNLIFLETDGPNLTEFLEDANASLGWVHEVLAEKLSIVPIFCKYQVNANYTLLTNDITNAYRNLATLRDHSGLEYHSLAFESEDNIDPFFDRLKDFLLSNPLPCYEVLKNTFRARCLAVDCKRRLKEKIEFDGHINPENASDFRWLLRLECVCGKTSVCARKDNGEPDYDRNPSSAIGKLISSLQNLPAQEPLPEDHNNDIEYPIRPFRSVGNLPGIELKMWRNVILSPDFAYLLAKKAAVVSFKAFTSKGKRFVGAVLSVLFAFMIFVFYL